MIKFQEIDLKALAPNPANGGRFEPMGLLQRIDPLFGESCRIVSGAKLQPDQTPDLEDFVLKRGFCPFCADVIGKLTFPFPSEIVPAGRIVNGSSWVVPNILAYSTYSAVGVYDTSRHFLHLGDFTEEILFNAFSGMLEHGRSVRRHDNAVRYSSINANYLPSSGSSLPHPHLQSSHDFVPLSSQRRMESLLRSYAGEYGSTYFGDLISQERGGARWVGKVGSYSFLVPFAPSGFHEVWAVHDSKTDLVEMNDEDTTFLASGLAKVLGVYEKKNLSAFNFSLQGLPVESAEFGSRILFRITTRSAIEPYYRSDVTYFERLCGEAMIDYLPEAWAEELRSEFDA